MLAAGDTVTLFGRFRQAARGEIADLLVARGVRVVRDLTRQTGLLAVGSGASNLIAGGHLSRRLDEARERDVRVLGEARLLGELSGRPADPSTLPLAKAGPDLPAEIADLLNAFDLIALRAGQIRFEDADSVRAAATLFAQEMAPADIVATLLQRRKAPKGRHRLTTDGSGQPVLEWEDGRSTLTGQFLLPIDEGDSVEQVFETALEAEAAGDLATAERLYETCIRAERRDPIAPFNLGNVLASMGRAQAAKLSYERAIANDPGFAEAHFNLATVLERQGDGAAAARHLRRATELDPDYAAPLFNLAQLERSAGRLTEAEALYRRFVEIAGTTPLADRARDALRLIRADLAQAARS